MEPTSNAGFRVLINIVIFKKFCVVYPVRQKHHVGGNPFLKSIDITKNMRAIVFLLTFMTIGTYVLGQSISKADSLEIASKIDDWNKGWKVKDYKLTTKWYSDAAEFTNAFGHSKIGRPEIEKFMKEVFQLPFVMAGDSRVTKQKFVMLDSKIVLVITSIERTGQRTPDEKDLGTRQTTHHRVFRKDDEWLIVGHLISDARDTESNKH